MHVQKIEGCSMCMQSSGLVRHVFRLLGKARDSCRPVPWVLLENVRASASLPAPGWQCAGCDCTAGRRACSTAEGPHLQCL